MDDFGLLVFLLPPADCQGYNVSMNTPALAALGIQLGALCLLGKLSLSGVNILSLPSMIRFVSFSFSQVVPYWAWGLIRRKHKIRGLVLQESGLMSLYVSGMGFRFSV